MFIQYFHCRKRKRAERFGSQITETKQTAQKTKSISTGNPEVASKLAARAARFG